MAGLLGCRNDICIVYVPHKEFGVVNVNVGREMSGKSCVFADSISGSF